MDMSGGLPNGSLGGHMLPGVVFLVWAVFWLVDLLRETRTDDAALETWWALRLGKPTLAVTGIVLELSWGGLFQNWSLNNLQHATMYGVFLASGLVDIASARGWLPASLTYYAFAFACLLSGLLFMAHPNHGPLATTVHTLIVVLFFALCVVATVEARRGSGAISWVRTGLLIALGTWFIQVAFSLYGTNAEPMAPDGKGIALLLFSWHLLAVACAMVLLRVFSARGTPPTASPTRLE